MLSNKAFQIIVISGRGKGPRHCFSRVGNSATPDTVEFNTVWRMLATESITIWRAGVLSSPNPFAANTRLPTPSCQQMLHLELW